MGPGHFDRRPQIDGPDFGAVFGRVIREPAIAAAGIQNLLAAKEIRTVWLHVIKKALIPLFVHLGKPGPLEAKTKRRLHLRLFVAGCRFVIEQRFAQRRKQQTRNVSDNRKLLSASSTFKAWVAVILRLIVTAQRRLTGWTAQCLQQFFYRE